MDDPSQSSRKRRKAGKDEGEQSEKKQKTQRGRPRVDGQEESAADRRRTQIRLAQRAYRQRKETTISTLTVQVEGLQKTIEELKRVFLDFTDYALKTDIVTTNPDVVTKLQSSVEHFTQLCEKANETAEEHHTHSDSDNIHEKVPQPKHRRASSSTQPLHNANWLGPPYQPVTAMPISQFAPAHQPSIELPLGYLQVYEEPSDPMSDVEEIGRGNLRGSDYATDNSELVERTSSAAPSDLSVEYDNTSSYSALLATPHSADMSTSWPVKAQNTLRPFTPFTSINLGALSADVFYETKFAHSIRRWSVIKGLELLQSEYTHPAEFHQAFQLPLLYETKDQLISKFTLLRGRPLGQHVNIFHTPNIHLGGAGTHYSQPLMEHSYFIKPGSYEWCAKIEKSDGTPVGSEIDVDWEDYGGEWYDPGDIEGFLQERGISYDRESMVARGEVDASEVPDELIPQQQTDESLSSVSSQAMSPAPSHGSGSTVSTLASPNMPQFQPLGFDLGPAFLFPNVPSMKQWTPETADPLVVDGFATSPEAVNSSISTADTSLAPGIVPEIVTNSLDTNPWATFGCAVPPSMSRGTTWPQTGMSKKLVTVDLKRMVHELLLDCVCIGRAPAFRKRDVEKAFQRSITSVR